MMVMVVGIISVQMPVMIVAVVVVTMMICKIWYSISQTVSDLISIKPAGTAAKC